MARELTKMTMDGNTAAAYSSYAFTEVAGIFPITPSSPMADYTDQWAQQGKKNIFGQTVNVVEMQSEGGAAGAVHGSLATGALTTTYTASQGLLLMIPNMYKISGELLPCVFHVSARALAAHALNIFGDHSDVMSCRQTGFAMLCSNSVQEVADLAAVAHLSTIKGRVPFIHFFDGFRTSHEIQKIELIDYADFADLVDYEALAQFRKNALSPNHPTLRGTAQNPDIYFQAREAANPFYLALPEIVEYYMDKINEIRGTNYKLFNYYGAEDADRIIIAMGSVDETIEETVDYLTAKGEKVGLLKVHLYRPFAVEKFLAAIPASVKKIAVLDRTKEPGSFGEPLFLDVCAAYAGKADAPQIIAGRFGLGSKDTTPSHILAIYKELAKDEPKKQFTLAINDDVTNLSLTVDESIDVASADTISARFWGLGSDGTVGANKNSIKIIGDHTDMYAQAYFSYDSKKSGGITISDLRFGKTPIRSTYLIDKADFVACHNQSYVYKYDMLSALKPNGTFLLNTEWTKEEVDANLPGEMKRYMAKNNIKFYILDAVAKAKEIGMKPINTICQSAFFKLSGILPVDQAVEYMKKAAYKSYSKKGDDIVNMNYAAIEAGVDAVVEYPIPASWADAPDTEVAKKDVPAFISEIVEPMNAQKGDALPVSAFKGREDGTFPQGTAAYEKRGTATDIPVWDATKCIQCNQCSLVCPHAAIRPFLLNEEEAAKASFETADTKPKASEYKFRMQVSALDCLSCGVCVTVCPEKVQAIKMVPLKDNMVEADNWEYCVSLSHKENTLAKTTVKGSQMEQPLLEFSGACAGCGETPYAKLLTQLFGDRMQISNATGCSSIWGGSAPSMPYTTNYKGQGPAWANSLFEDNAEHGLGMYLGVKQLRNRVKSIVTELSEKTADEALKASIAAWIENFENGEKTREVSDNMAAALKAANASGEEKALIGNALSYEDYFAKRSQWIIGGDGWSYDIGYGGLDHVLASGEDVNVLVLDTEVYSNTGGQASKSTPQSAIAQFAAGGKAIKKKDLGMMAMSYGYVYVAQVAMGANSAQVLKAFAEAEAYHGPSLVICYAPCINHGIKGGLKGAQMREKAAVECGYWHLYRFNPTLKDEGKNPFTLDSKEPTGDFIGFLKDEVRYNSLYKKYPADVVDAMFEKTHQDAIERYESYKNKAGL
ncbi:MAG: pyruvate:ferredoxin (flavodoxin) oxidoreductase [Clostridiales bacterium]|nr:pyruvate:ferredoxin (flavodoxin) oxidoreductase [Candidatus Scatonaster coprocaballi]